MFSELINVWDLIVSFMQGLAMVLVPFFKALFTPPLIIFPLLWLANLGLKHRIR